MESGERIVSLLVKAVLSEAERLREAMKAVEALSGI